MTKRDRQPEHRTEEISKGKHIWISRNAMGKWRPGTIVRCDLMLRLVCCLLCIVSIGPVVVVRKVKWKGTKYSTSCSEQDARELNCISKHKKSACAHFHYSFGPFDSVIQLCVSVRARVRSMRTYAAPCPLRAQWMHSQSVLKTVVAVGCWSWKKWSSCLYLLITAVNGVMKFSLMN